MNNNVKLFSFKGCLQREIMRFLKEPIQTIFNVIFSDLLFVVALYFLSPSQMNFLLPGIVIYVIANVTFSNTRMTIFIGKIESVIYYQLAAPISKVLLYVTYIIANFIRVMLTVTILLIIVLPLFYHGNVKHICLFFCMFTITTITFTNIGILASLIYKNWNSVGAVESYIFQPLLYLSGSFFSLKYVPDVLQPLFYFNPFFNFTNVLRYTFGNVYELNIFVSIIISLLIFLISTISCLIIFHNGYRLLE